MIKIIARIKDINPPINNVLPMLIVPPRSFFAKISPKIIQNDRITILDTYITTELDTVLLKNKYSIKADRTPASKPKIHVDFCILITNE